MNYILFGGSGFIGTHLIHLLLKECVRPGDVIYDLDLVMPGEEGVVPGVVEKNDGVQYIRLDVRKPIDFEFTPTPEDVIFDLAAVHRTPGHPEEAYFETNIRGAENVTAFAEKYGRDALEECCREAILYGKCSYTYISSTISMYSTPAPELPIDRMKSSLRPVSEDTVVTGVYKDDDEKYSLQRLLSRQEEGER